MFHLKNDDMEELFRKAAENYSVDITRASDWERVRASLESGEPQNNTEFNHRKKKNKKRGLFLWWLLLLPVAWTAHNGWNTLSNVRAVIAPPMQMTPPVSNEMSMSRDLSNEFSSAQSRTVQHQSGNGRSMSGSLVPVPGIKNDHSYQRELKGNKWEVGVDSSFVKKAIVKPKAGPRNKLSGWKLANTNKRSGATQNAVDESNDKAGKTTPDELDNGRLSKTDISKQMQNDQSNLKDRINGAGTIVPLLQQVGNAGETVLPPLAPGITVMGERKADLDNESSEANQITKVEVRQQRGIYLQAIAAADFTSVQYQKVKAMGYGAGLLLGYQFNNRWHIETGAMWERKDYYTKGKHFNASKLGYLSNHTIYEVDGYCNMITIPLSVRYNLSTYTSINKWFVTAGVAAYLMNKEDYDIIYDYLGQPRQRNFVYDHPPQSWLATVKLSGGYERRIGKHLQLRIEPYVKIPAGKVGSGSLSLQSAGLSIGVGKSF